MPHSTGSGRAKVIAIVGPTSSGKTALGVWLAKRIQKGACGAEIISADSRQVYKGLNIGTGKVTKREMAGVKHHLLDVASPKKQFSADDFVRLGEKVISGLIYQSTPRIPIVVGGTGFYVDTLLGRMSIPQVPPNPALRAQLEKKSAPKLFAQLKKLDPLRAATIEPEHKRRLIRAIEIAKAIGSSPPLNSKQKYDVLWLGLKPQESVLQKNIHARLVERINAGMVREARQLHAKGLSYKRMNELGLEYRYLSRLLQHKITKAEFEKQLEQEINRYAKRQMRWFKRNGEIHWINNKLKALRLAKEFISARLKR